MNRQPSTPLSRRSLRNRRNRRPISAEPETSAKQPPQPTVTHTRLIPLEQIVPNPYQPRKQFAEDALQELADSIREHGVLQPILLRQKGENRFEIIAGERRFRASKLAGLTTIPAFVRRFSDQEQAILSLIENLQREDLSPVEKARSFRTLIQEFGLTQKEIAESVGKAPTTISHWMRLLELSEEMLDSLDRGEIQEKHAQCLLRIEDEGLRERFFQQAVIERLSARELAQRIRAESGMPTVPALPTTVSLPQPEKAELAETRRTQLAGMSETAINAALMERFSRRVRIISPEEHNGRIEIGFYDREDLITLTTMLLFPPL